MSLTAGQQLGPYEIIEPIGAGGMGEVYKAKDNRLDRIVAIKILNIHIANNPDLKARFDREAKAISSLNHPNICTLYDIGSENEQDYLVMEYIEGETLSERLKKGALPMTELLQIAVSTADALENAHRKGLIHRDLKPGNIMLTKEGAKLLDFGLAKLQVESEQPGMQSITQTTPLTGTGTLIGTMQYMSPEQLEGNEADKRSDIFSFGAILYEMATGGRPFHGNSQASLIASILKEEPRSVSEVLPAIPPMLEQTVSQCLEKDPDQRWQSAGDLKRALKWIADGKVTGRPTGLIPQNRSTRENIIFASLILFILVSGWLGYKQFFADKDSRQTTRTNLLPPENSLVETTSGGHLAISPDGTRLAFVARDSVTDEFVLWVRPLHSLTAVSLSGTKDAMYPFWSPDGKQIGFFAGSRLKKVPSIGGPVLTLCETKINPRGGSWNKDNIIIFAPSINDPIFQVSGAGGDPKPVTTMDSTLPENSQRFPVFLPDDDHFLFFSRTISGSGGEKDAICISALSDPTVTRLILAKSNAHYSNGHIFYTRESFLMAQPFDASDLKLTGDPFPYAEEIIFSLPYNKGDFTVDEQGPLIYGTGVAPDGKNIIMFDRNGRLVDTILSGETYYTAFNSHDGKKLLTNIYDPTIDNSDIWIYDYDRKLKTRFTFDTAIDANAMYMRDDKNVIFSSDRIKNDFSVYIKDASGTFPESLLVNEEGVNIFVSQVATDNTTLLLNKYYKKRDISEIWQLDVSSGKSQQLIASEFNSYMGVLSPDMRWLMYGSDESGKEEVFITKYPELTGKWQVSINEGDRPHWRSDGKEIFYLDNQDNICAASVDGTGSSIKIGAVQTLFGVSGQRPGNIYFPTSVGQKFVCVVNPASTTSNQIVLVQNWYDELMKR